MKTVSVIRLIFSTLILLCGIVLILLSLGLLDRFVGMPVLALSDGAKINIVDAEGNVIAASDQFAVNIPVLIAGIAVTVFSVIAECSGIYMLCGAGRQKKSEIRMAEMEKKLKIIADICLEATRESQGDAACAVPGEPAVSRSFAPPRVRPVFSSNANAPAYNSGLDSGNTVNP